MIKLSKAELKVLEEFDPVRDIDQWSAYAANHSIEWTSTIPWNAPRATEAIHPSSLGNPCDMMLFLELIGGGSVRKNVPTLQKVYDVGTAVHEVLQYYHGTRALFYNYDYWQEIGFDYRKQSEVPELRMSGHCDGVSEGWPLKENKLLWEFKSIRSSAYERLKTPSAAYIAQVHAYMANLGIPYSVILYINKDDSNLAAFKIPFKKSIWQPHEDRIKRIVELVDQIKEPTKLAGRHCFKCRFFEECEPKVPTPVRYKEGLPEI